MMTNKKKHLKFKEVQEALDSIKEMENAGLKRVLPIPIWLGAILALLIGTQIALLGAGIRTYNTILIVLICIMVIAIINNNRLAGVTERIILSKRTVIISITCLIPTYFLLIIIGQYLKSTFDYNWAPFAIGAFIVIILFSIIVSARRSYFSRINDEKI